MKITNIINILKYFPMKKLLFINILKYFPMKKLL